MTLLKRIFSTTSEPINDVQYQPFKSNFDPMFNQILLNNYIDSIRLVVCMERRRKSIELLYDSRLSSESEHFGTSSQSNNANTFEYDRIIRPIKNQHDRVCLTKHTSNTENSERRPPDYKMLSEMIFGNLMLQERNAAIKLHILNDPVRVMVSKLYFAAQIPETTRGESSLKSERHSFISLVDFVERKKANFPCSQQTLKQTTSTKIPANQSVPSSPSSDRAACSPTSSISSSIGATSHMSSKFIRWLATQRSQILDEDVELSTSASRRSKIKCEVTIGVAVVIPLLGKDLSLTRIKRFNNSIFAHSPLIESIIDEMIFSMESTVLCISKRTRIYFKKMEYDINMRIRDLFCSPRLLHPAWISLTQTSDTTVRSRRIKQFVDVFRELFFLFSTAKVFLNCLLTAVLGHHINWVNTVAPGGRRTDRMHLMKHRADWASDNRGKTPYSAYATQLHELVGSIGRVGLRRQSRTVIAGASEDIVVKLVYVMSYYIRGSSILSNLVKPFDLVSTRAETVRNLDQYRKQKQLEAVLNEKIDLRMTTQHFPTFPPVAFCFDLPFIRRFLRENSEQDGCFEIDLATSSKTSIDEHLPVSDSNRKTKCINSQLNKKGEKFADILLDTVEVDNCHAMFVPLLDLEVCKTNCSTDDSQQMKRCCAGAVDGFYQLAKHTANQLCSTELKMDDKGVDNSMRTSRTITNLRCDVLRQQKSSFLFEHSDNFNDLPHQAETRNILIADMPRQTSINKRCKQSQLNCGYIDSVISKKTDENCHLSSIHTKNKQSCRYRDGSVTQSAIDFSSSSSLSNLPLALTSNTSEDEFVDTLIVDMAMALFGGYCDHFIPELVVQGCSSKISDIHSIIVNRVFPRYHVAMEAQAHASHLLANKTRQLSLAGSQYLLGPLPPRKSTKQPRKSFHRKNDLSESLTSSSASRKSLDLSVTTTGSQIPCDQSVVDVLPSIAVRNRINPNSTDQLSGNISVELNENCDHSISKVYEQLLADVKIKPDLGKTSEDGTICNDRSASSSLITSPSISDCTQVISTNEAISSPSHMHENRPTSNDDLVGFQVLRQTFESVTQHINNLRFSNRKSTDNKRCSQKNDLTSADDELTEPLEAITKRCSSGSSDSEAVFILADAESETVSICSSKDYAPRRSGYNQDGFNRKTTEVKPSHSVADMLQMFNCLCQAAVPAECCLHALEDYLQNIYMRGKSVHDYSVEKGATLRDSITALGLNVLDLPLYTAVDDVLSFEETVKLQMMDLYGDIADNDIRK